MATYNVSLDHGRKHEKNQITETASMPATNPVSWSKRRRRTFVIMLQIIFSRVSSSPAFDMERDKYIRATPVIWQTENFGILWLAQQTLVSGNGKTADCWRLNGIIFHAFLLRLANPTKVRRRMHFRSPGRSKTGSSETKASANEHKTPKFAETNCIRKSLNGFWNWVCLFVFSPSIQLIASWFDLISTCLARSIVGCRINQENSFVRSVFDGFSRWLFR